MTSRSKCVIILTYESITILYEEDVALMVTNKENLYKLGQKMTDRIPYKLGFKKLDESCPEYWGLANVLDDDMVSIALSM